MNLVRVNCTCHVWYVWQIKEHDLWQLFYWPHYDHIKYKFYGNFCGAIIINKKNIWLEIAKKDIPNGTDWNKSIFLLQFFKYIIRLWNNKKIFVCTTTNNLQNSYIGEQTDYYISFFKFPKGKTLLFLSVHTTCEKQKNT